MCAASQDPHDSLHEGVAEFFLACNETRFTRADWPRELLKSPPPLSISSADGDNGAGVSADVAEALEAEHPAELVLSFSHFVPRPELFQGSVFRAVLETCRLLTHPTFSRS